MKLSKKFKYFWLDCQIVFPFILVLCYEFLVNVADLIINIIQNIFLRIALAFFCLISFFIAIISPRLALDIMLIGATDLFVEDYES